MNLPSFKFNVDAKMFINVAVIKDSHSYIRVYVHTFEEKFVLLQQLQLLKAIKLQQKIKTQTKMGTNISRKIPMW